LVVQNQLLPSAHEIFQPISTKLSKECIPDEGMSLPTGHFQLLLRLIQVETREQQPYIPLFHRLIQLDHILLSYTSSSFYEMILVHFNCFLFLKDSQRRSI